MQRWQAFLDSLLSPGGRVLLIVIMLVFLVGVSMAMHMSGRDPAETGRALLISSFTSLFTLLVAYLAKDKQGG
jgi:hypothetical protein